MASAFMHLQEQLERTQKGEKPFSIPNVTSYFKIWVIQKIMKWPTQEKSHFSVQNMISDLYKEVVWEPIQGSLEQRSHIPVPNVACHLQIVESWRCVKGSTQERSYLLLSNLTSHSQKNPTVQQVINNCEDCETGPQRNIETVE